MINGNHDLILWGSHILYSGERKDRLSSDTKLSSLVYTDITRRFENVRTSILTKFRDVISQKILNIVMECSFRTNCEWK
jgi:hypothetical protein